MGRPGSGKPLFLRHLFSLITRNKEPAQFVSGEILELGGRVVLKIGDSALECSKPEREDEAAATCYIDMADNEKVYLLYEGWLFAAKCGELLHIQKIADAVRGLIKFQK
jgi:hypothetical protein